MKYSFTYFLILAAMLLGNKIHAQKNVVKLNLPSTVVGNLYLSYERVLSDKKTVSLAFAFMPSRTLPFSDYVSDDNGSETEIKYDNLRMSGFSITPEFRFYTARRKEAPRGFYLAPYLRYQNLGIKGDYTKVYYDDDLQRTNTAHFNGKGKYSIIAAGCQLGVQWLIADRFSIDWNFFGIGIGNYKISLQESSNDVGPNYYGDGGDGKVALDGIPFNPTFEYTRTSAKGSVSTLLPHFRSGLSIGFAF